MRNRVMTALAGAASLAVAEPATAQAAGPADADTLAEQWRAAKRAELIRQQAAIAAQLAALDKGVNPDTLAAAALPDEAPKKAEPRKADETKGGGAGKDDETKGGDGKNPASEGKQKFGGIEFGVGVSFTADLGSRDRIGSAALDQNKIVRVDDENNGRARIMLESHYFFTPCGRFLGINGLGTNGCTFKSRQLRDGRTVYEVDERLPANWGIGPFIALQPGGDENVIEAIGMGLMVGFRRGPETTQSFNFGVGYVIDPNSRVLGDGIRQDQPLPAGESEIRFKETSQGGVLFLASFSF